ncbi:MAG: phosphoribosyltransferase family protein [Pseudomonadota bacterium]
MPRQTLAVKDAGRLNHGGDMKPILRETKRFAADLTDTIWPQRSILSGHPARGALTPEDFTALSFITGPVCQSCGQPQEIDLGTDTICAACTARPPPWTTARAALAYDDVSRKPILALKRQGRRDGLKVMARWMCLSGQEAVAKSNLIVPVPLHYRRLVSRGYNQSGWLAAEISRQTGLALFQTALKRTRATPSQAGLSRRARARNVKGAFSVRRSHVKLISGKKVLLVDDVLTTGATLGAAARALAKAGAEEIHALVLARVVQPTDITI